MAFSTACVRYRDVPPFSMAGRRFPHERDNHGQPNLGAIAVRLAVAIDCLDLYQAVLQDGLKSRVRAVIKAGSRRHSVGVPMKLEETP